MVAVCVWNKSLYISPCVICDKRKFIFSWYNQWIDVSYSILQTTITLLGQSHGKLFISVALLQTLLLIVGAFLNNHNHIRHTFWSRAIWRFFDLTVFQLIWLQSLICRKESKTVITILTIKDGKVMNRLAVWIVRAWQQTNQIWRAKIQKFLIKFIWKIPNVIYYTYIGIYLLNEVNSSQYFTNWI